MLKVVNIVGARPNFMKIAPIHHQMRNNHLIDPILVHTGQHYDEKMSKTFFVDLCMPEPDIYLGVGSGSHASQTAAVMTSLEKVLIDEKPDWIVVVGDVNSTLAGALVASKLNIPIAHVEAGLRSFDRTMPEEINRILTDSISDLLFVTEKSGLDNLLKEGVAKEKVHFVGNVMIDSLKEHLPKAKQSNLLRKLNCEKYNYVLMTLHRPSNVDNADVFAKILNALEQIQKDKPILFPIHPRTRKMISQLGFSQKVQDMKNLIFMDPLGYLEFLNMMNHAQLVLTDSGGIQEETTYLGVPCITLRENTERPCTVELGTNQLVDLNTEKIIHAALNALNGNNTEKKIPPLWDGETAQRIVDILIKQPIS